LQVKPKSAQYLSLTWILNVEKKSVMQKMWKNDHLEIPENGFEPVAGQESIFLAIPIKAKKCPIFIPTSLIIAKKKVVVPQMPKIDNLEKPETDFCRLSGTGSVYRSFVMLCVSGTL
jgi:hypothetical protein